MQAIKTLTKEDTHFEALGKEVAAVDVVILYGETPSSMPLAARYEALQAALSAKYNIHFDETTTYLALEKAVQMAAELKKTTLSSPSLKSSELALTDPPKS